MDNDLYFMFKHIWKHINQIKEKCGELHKSGNGYKKATCLKMPMSTVRAIPKKFKAVSPHAQWGGWLERQKNPQGSLLENYRGK